MEELQDDNDDDMERVKEIETWLYLNKLFIFASQLEGLLQRAEERLREDMEE